MASPVFRHVPPSSAHRPFQVDARGRYVHRLPLLVRLRLALMRRGWL